MGPFYTTSYFIANISGTSQDIQNWKDMRSRFVPRSVKQVRWTLVHYPESRTCGVLNYSCYESFIYYYE